jgi:hypothetical protein
MLTGWKRERRIRKVPSGLARQRVAMVAPPNNIWIIEQALKRGEHTEADLATCLMRGWVEPLHEDMPWGELDVDNLPRKWPAFTGTQTVYRLTEGDGPRSIAPMLGPSHGS